MVTRTLVRTRALAFGLLALIALPFGLFAVHAAGVETARLAGLDPRATARAAPPFFVLHALAGTVALISGITQFGSTVSLRFRSFHRLGGRVYLAAVLISALSAVPVALEFDVPSAATTSFVVLAALWISSSLIAVREARRRRRESHRAWASRSYALTLFFLTFSVWLEALRPWVPEAGLYPMAVTLGWFANLLVVEALIRGGKTARDPAPSDPSSAPGA